jgi:hypothetical protein
MMHVMRLTINLDDDLYAMARTHAILKKTSLSKAVGDLLRRRQAAPLGADAPNDGTKKPHIHPQTGFPIIELDPGVTMEDIRRAQDDDDVRHLEMMGLNPGEIERTLNS